LGAYLHWCRMIDLESDEYFMREALKEADRAFEKGEVPVGAVVVLEKKIIARAHNQVELLKDATAHAEILALTQAANTIDNWRLINTTLYVTKEPCFMCAGALVNARVKRLVFGARDPKSGGAGSALNIVQDVRQNHMIEVEGGVLEEPSKLLLQEFFRIQRSKSNN